MPLSERDRALLPDSAFAYVDSRGGRRLPIHDAAHVRNALARFGQVAFEDAAARERARRRLIRAAARFGVAPVGFVTRQLREERVEGEADARARRMVRWPRGTVTFLLTDIEGSTRLLERLGDAYTALLRRVRALHRASVRRAGGHEVDARADEYFAAFADASRALEAALEIQRALRAEPWPRGARVRVRAGLHTGRSAVTDAGYVGIAVHTAARVCSTGAGGQIVLTAATRDALRAGGTRAALRALGERALAGIREPVTLYRVSGR
ncbi:MAG TPA: adenylate/guanylate cyclase domain-containing protein [Candidatus Limnocylindria bacterium]|nr:adenylate/guanylate cyclase domain-containing protein [Candidatus Limnocylindria bacterium]